MNFSLANFIVLVSLVCWADVAAAAPISKRVTVQTIQLCSDSGIDCANVNTFEAASDKIWAQAGIDLAYLPTLQWNSSRFNSTDSTIGEELDLWKVGNSIFGDPSLGNILNIYFVSEFLVDPGFILYGEGCGPAFSDFCGGLIGIVINATEVNAYAGGLGRIDTLAHEVGHVLGLGHNNFGAGAGDNLMTSGSYRFIPGSLNDINPDGYALGKLSEEQIVEARYSLLLEDFKGISEPATCVLISIALLAMRIRSNVIK